MLPIRHSRNCLVSNSSDMKEKYFLEYKSLPYCINEGCNKYVTVREWKYWSFKSECNRCSKARKLGKILQGITIHKKKYFENKNSHLWFDFSLTKDFKGWDGFKMAFDMDHINGERVDNKTENLKTYCKLCHYRKKVSQVIQIGGRKALSVLKVVLIILVNQKRFIIIHFGRRVK